MRTSTSSSHARYFSASLATAAFSSSETRRSRNELEVGEVAAEAARGRRMMMRRRTKRYAREALTSPALLSQRERREKDGEKSLFFWLCSPLSLRERGVRGVRASEGRPPIPSQTLWGLGLTGNTPGSSSLPGRDARPSARRSGSHSRR